MLTLEEIFPPYALRLACGPVEMRVLRDDDLPELVELVRGGIDVPGLPMPFLSDWHAEPWAPGAPEGFPASSLQWWWTQRAAFSPQEWRLALTVRRGGELVGMQDVHALHFAQTRHVETGSWLGRAHQGRGTGTLMRQMVVGLAFRELGALTCGSAYVVGNEASAGVSRRTGYVENGRRRIVQHIKGEAVGVEEQVVVITPQTYAPPAEPLRVEGAEALRAFLGVEQSPTPAEGDA